MGGHWSVIRWLCFWRGEVVRVSAGAASGEVALRIGLARVALMLVLSENLTHRDSDGSGNGLDKETKKMGK